MLNCDPADLIGKQAVRTIIAAGEAGGAIESALAVMPTGQLLELIEGTAYDFVIQYLTPGHRTVGLAVEFRHTAATPSGQAVTVTLSLVAVKGREFVFEVVVSDELDVVCTGTYSNYVVNIDRFNARVASRFAEIKARSAA